MANRIIPYNKHLRALARELRNNMTEAEMVLWERIRRKQLGVEFHRQVPILDYIVDFYCHEIGLAIEVDGEIHQYNFLEDAYRQGKIEKYGVQFLRFTNQQVFEEINSVLNLITEKIKESLD